MKELEFTGISMQGRIALKLREARKGAGLSTREVAEALHGRFEVSHTTIANYEKARGQPSLALLVELASIYDRPINWFLENGLALTGICYRNHSSRLRVSDRHQYEASALRWLQGYMKLEEHLGLSMVAPYRRPKPLPGDFNPSRFAAATREQLQIGLTGAVPSVIDVLEQFGIRVVELSTVLPIDGFAALLGNQPVVVLNAARSDDRIRLNAAHELFHVLLGHCEGSSDAARTPAEPEEHEDAAFACARNFLLPPAQLHEAFAGESFVKLVKFKEKFGISVSAMVYAARQEGILSERTARHLWIEMNRRGWRENEPGRVRPDRATRFEELVDGAISQGRLSLKSAAAVIGVREAELTERLQSALATRQQVETDLPEGGAEKVYGLRLAK